MKNMEYNFELVEGMQRRIDVALVKPDGSALPCENFLVYGAAFAPGCEARPFEVKRTARGCTVVVPGLCATRMGWHYQLLAAEYATGVEWVVASGEIAVAPRLAHAEGAVSPEGVELVCTVDHVTQSVDVVVGESTVECAAAAEYAKESAEAAAELCGRAATAAEEAQRSAEAAQKSADDAEDLAQRADDYMADAEAASESASTHALAADVNAKEAERAAADAAAAAGTAGARAADAAASAKAAADAASDALEAAGKAAADAGEAAAAEVAGALAELAQQSGDNNFTGNNTHAGAEVFNGEMALNGGITYPGGSTTAAELAAGYFYARRYWELSANIANLFKSQNIDALPKDEDGLVKLSFPNAIEGSGAFCFCRCNSGVAISLPAVTSQSKLDGILNGLHNSSGNDTYGYITVKLSLPKMTSISLDYPLRLWAEKIIIDAPNATYFKCDARKYAVYGNLPVCEEIVCDNSYYAGWHKNQFKWFVALPSLKKGSWGKPGVGGEVYRLSADSVFCILGTVPIWTDGGAHSLHLNILPALKNDADFQARLALALGAQNEDGTYKGALVREYVAGGSSGADELGAYNDAYVDGKGWQITISYN